jgi:hypothetical protein
VGLLDDLKREADKAREARDAEEARRLERERIYRSAIVPGLASIYRYLMEIIEHLKEVKWIVNAVYDIPGLGVIDTFRQEDYRIFIDSHETPKKINFFCTCNVPEERKYQVSTDKIEDARQFLTVNNIIFSDWPLRSGGGQITTMVVQAKLRIRVGLLVEADIDSSRIRVLSHNLEGLAHREYFFGPSAIDEDWLDDLGHYLLRKKPFLGKQEMTLEARERLRRFLEQERVQRLRERASGAILDERKMNDSGFFQTLRGRLFKSDKPD